MATPAYPSTLPAPVVPRYTIKHGEAINRTNMDSGPARQRRLFTQVPSQIILTWIMNQDEHQLFQGWYKHQAKEGASYFTINLLSGNGILPHTARFRGQPSVVLTSQNTVSITATLEVRELPTIAADTVELLATNSIQSVTGALDALSALLSTTIPQALS